MRLKLLVAATLLSFGLIARADTITYDFSVTAANGPLAGQTSSGSFPYDSSVIQPGADVNAGNLLTSLNFTWNGISYTAATANTGWLDFNASGQLTSFCFGSNATAGTCPLTGGHNEFFVSSFGLYYSTSGTTGAYTGTVSYELVPAATTPEPSSLALLGTGVLGFAGVLRKRLA